VTGQAPDAARRRPAWKGAGWAGLVVAALVAGVTMNGCGGGPSPLAGTTWALTAVDGRAPAAGAPVWLTFGEDGSIAGSTGCNAIGGRWKASGSELRIAELSATLIACPGAVGEVEAAFTAALRQAASFAIAGGRLNIMDETGATRLSFVASR
jgi:putative lipoprotein